MALCAICYIVAISAVSYGSLPQRIATHWNFAGVVNGWGDKSSLWWMVGLACLLYTAFSCARFIPPSLFSLPVSPGQRAAALPISIEMAGWVKAEVLCLLALSVQTIVASAEGHASLSHWLQPAVIIAIFATTALCIVRMWNLDTTEDGII